MQLHSILAADAVVLGLKPSSKKKLFCDIAKLGDSQFGIPAADLQEALVAREDLGSTAMGNGIAIPHARVEGIDAVCGIFIKLDEPVDFDASDHKPVDLVFALFAPKDSSSEHLKALARVARVLRDEKICAKLRSASDGDAIYAILTETHDSVAA